MHTQPHVMPMYSPSISPTMYTRDISMVQQPVTGMTNQFQQMNFETTPTMSPTMIPTTIMTSSSSSSSSQVQQQQFSSSSTITDTTTTTTSTIPSISSLGLTEEEMNNTILVTGFKSKIERKEIISIFEPFGSISQVNILPNQTNINTPMALISYTESKSIQDAIEKLNQTLPNGAIEPLTIKLLSDMEETPVVQPTKLPDPIDPGQFIYQQGYFIPYSNYSPTYSYNYSMQPTNNQHPTMSPVSTNILSNEQYPSHIPSYPVYHQQQNLVPGGPTAGTYTSSVPISNPHYIPQTQSEYYLSPEGRLYVRSPR